MVKRGRKKGQKGKKWTQADLDFVKSTYLFLSDKEIGEILGRDLKTIHTIRRKHGWLKNKDNKKKQDFCKKVPLIIVLPSNLYDEHVKDYQTLNMEV